MNNPHTATSTMDTVWLKGPVKGKGGREVEVY